MLLRATPSKNFKPAKSNANIKKNKIKPIISAKSHFLSPLKILVGPMRKWDYRAAQRPDEIIANSTHTKDMIKKYYGRDSQIIFPPIDTKRFTPGPEDKTLKRKGFVTTPTVSAPTSFASLETATRFKLAAFLKEK